MNIAEWGVVSGLALEVDRSGVERHCVAVIIMAGVMAKAVD